MRELLPPARTIAVQSVISSAFSCQLSPPLRGKRRAWALAPPYAAPFRRRVWRAKAHALRTLRIIRGRSLFEPASELARCMGKTPFLEDSSGHRERRAGKLRRLARQRVIEQPRFKFVRF